MGVPSDRQFVAKLLAIVPTSESDSVLLNDPNNCKSSTNSGRKRKRISEQPTQHRQKRASPSRSRSNTQEVEPVASTGNTPVPPLPEEIWLMIFKKCVKDQGALPFLSRASKVCHLWRNVASEPCLWKNVDLSFGWIKKDNTTLRWLSHHRLSRCENIILHNWKSLTSDTFQLFSRNCGVLQNVILSNCCMLTAADIMALVSNNPRLRKLVLSDMSSTAVSPQALKHVVQTIGHSLKYLALSCVFLKSPAEVLNHIMDYCPQLEHFAMQSCTFTEEEVFLDVERMQRSMPLLQELFFDYTDTLYPATHIVSAHRQAGFQNLQLLSLVDTEISLQRFLNTAQQLKILDVRGNSSFDPIVLFNCSSDNLEELYLGSSCTAVDYILLRNIFEKWRHSLRVVDLSWMDANPEQIHEAFEALVGPSDRVCPLTHLKLVAVRVAWPSVKLLLENMKELIHLDLSRCRCRDLPRGSKRVHEGRLKLEQLRQKISEMDPSRF